MKLVLALIQVKINFTSNMAICTILGVRGSALSSTSYLTLHGIEFGAANVAKISQWIFTVHGCGLDLLGRQVRFPVSADDFSHDFLGAGQDFPRGAKSNATQQGVCRNQILGITQVVPQGIQQGARAFTDEIGIQLLAMEDLSTQQIPPILMLLDDPSADAGAQCAYKRTKNGGKRCGCF
jgi:hypothetical protein